MRSTEFCSVYGGSFVPSYGGGGGALSSLDVRDVIGVAMVSSTCRCRGPRRDTLPRGGGAGDPKGVALGRKHRRYKNENENKSSTKQSRPITIPNTVRG